MKIYKVEKDDEDYKVLLHYQLLSYVICNCFSRLNFKICTPVRRLR